MKIKIRMKMKKQNLIKIITSFTLILCLTGATNLFGQTVYAGLSYTGMHYLGNNENIQHEILTRPEIGIQTNRTPIENDFGFDVTFLMSWKGGKYHYFKHYEALSEQSNATTVKSDVDIRLTYIEIPIIFDYEKGIFRLEAGPSLAFRIGSKRVGETIITSFSQDGQLIENQSVISETARYGWDQFFPEGVNAKNPIRFFDFGLNVGGSVKVAKNVRLNVRYHQGVLDVLRNNYPVKNSSTGYQANYAIKLGVQYEFGN